MGAFTKCSSKAFLLNWFKISPDVSAAHQCFAWSDIKLSSHFSQDSLSKAVPYAVPCSHYSQTRTAAHLGDTNTHLHTVDYHLQPGLGVEFLM